MPRKVQIPIISKELIQYLDSIFPEKSADSVKAFGIPIFLLRVSFRKYLVSNLNLGM